MLVNFAGRQIGRYALLNEIGRGGMGRVYRATRPDTTEQFAVKVVSLLTTTDSKFEARFGREIDVIRRLSHPSILPLLESGQESDGTLYMVMPLIEGGTLKAYLQQNVALTPAQVYLVVSQVGSALDYAHTQGIIHRDVKPHNIMMAGKGRVVLTDFGVAALGSTDETASNLTTTGATLGTFAYMSPEQIAGGNLDGRTDVYALGVVAYQSLLGMLPFTGDNTATLLTQQLHSRPLAPTMVNPEFPDAVTEVLEKSLAKDPAKRYANGAELTEALSAAFASLPREVASSLLVTQQQLMDSVGLTNDPLPTQTFTQITVPPPPLTLRQRVLRGLPLVLGVLALLVCLGVVVVAPLQQQLASVQSTADALASRPAVVITQMVTNAAGEQVFIMITATFDPNATPGTPGPTPTVFNIFGSGSTPTSGTTATVPPTSSSATGTASGSTTGGTTGGFSTSTPIPPTSGPTLPPTIPPTIGPTKTPSGGQGTQPVPPTAPSTTGGTTAGTTGGTTTGTTGGTTAGTTGTTGGQGTGGQGTAGQGQGGGSPP